MARSTLPPAMKDALLSAVVEKLPAPGTAFPASEREAWFTMMRNAVDVAYGPCERPAISIPTVFVNPAPDAAPPVNPEPLARWIAGAQATHRGFVIEPDGSATAEGRPVDPAEIPTGTIVHDYRPQPIDPEYNPIMWKTAGSAKLPLPAGVVIRGATDAWPGRGPAMNGEATT